jgi:SCY1-like protein 1
MDDDPADSWADDLEKSSQTPSHSTKTSTSTVPFDDGGEPDFEGWLNAQAGAKSQSKKPLPKGLAKKSTPATTAAAKSAPPARTSNALKPASRVALTSKSKATENTRAAEEDDDDWGNAWG